MELGVSREDAYNYIAVGCNELAIPGQSYFNPGASANYLRSIELALTSGKGYRGAGEKPLAPPAAELTTFDSFAAAVGAYMRDGIEKSYRAGMQVLKAQMQWGRTPFTSCFFDGCIERGRDMALGTKYNILSCGGVFFANAVDCLAAIREVVYERKEATLEEVAAACKANFQGHERLRAKLLAAPKHGNDDPRLDDIITLVERLRDEPMKEICRDPRDGTRFGNTHITKAGAVLTGKSDASDARRPAGGHAAGQFGGRSSGAERSGPTAVLNSVCKLNAAKSWQSGYQVNIRFQNGMLSNQGESREGPRHAERLFQQGRAGAADQLDRHGDAARGAEEPQPVPRSGGARGRVQRVLREPHAGDAGRDHRAHRAHVGYGLHRRTVAACNHAARGPSRNKRNIICGCQVQVWDGCLQPACSAPNTPANIRPGSIRRDNTLAARHLSRVRPSRDAEKRARATKNRPRRKSSSSSEARSIRSKRTRSPSRRPIRA